MQDRFKFRYNNNNEIYDVFAIDFFHSTGQIVSLDRKETLMCKINLDNLIQCTGLKDKNGKLIYEGDILKFKVLADFEAFGTNKKYVEIIAPVIYEYGGFFIEQSENSIFLGQLPMSEIEVIGNIYENPELLEKRT